MAKLGAGVTPVLTGVTGTRGFNGLGLNGLLSYGFLVVSGTDGSVGFTGTAGSTGTTGSTGFTGTIGATGVKGSTGATGPGAAVVVNEKKKPGLSWL